MALVHEFLMLPPDLTGNLYELRKKFIQGQTSLNIRYFSADEYPQYTSMQQEALKESENILRQFYTENRRRSIAIKDAYILPHLEKFKEIDTFMEGCVSYRGLNYYGYTVIPWGSLQAFVSASCNARIINEYPDLNTLFQDAYARNCEIFHCGI